MTTRRTLGVAAATTLLTLAPLLALAPSPASAMLDTAGPTRAAPAPPIRIAPQSLPSGPRTGLPHVEGRRFVAGSLLVRFDTRDLLHLGQVGRSHLVQRRRSVVRVTPAGKVKVVVARSGGEFLLSEDAKLLWESFSGPHRTRVTARDPKSGTRLHTRVFPGHRKLLAATGTRIVFSRWGGGTHQWNAHTDRVRLLTRRVGLVAEFGADRLASLTKDAYEGGCTVVSTLRAPRTALWRSCTRAVTSFSPDGSRLLSTDILSDGIGPTRLELRTVTGARTARYDTRWFGGQMWEGNTPVLQANSRKAAAWVRCTTSACENASRTWTPPYL